MSKLLMVKEYLPTRRYASAAISRHRVSVCLSVRHLTLPFAAVARVRQ